MYGSWCGTLVHWGKKEKKLYGAAKKKAFRTFGFRREKIHHPPFATPFSVQFRLLAGSAYRI